MIQGYRLAGKVFPPKAQGHVSQSCIAYFAADVGYGSLASIWAPWPGVHSSTGSDRNCDLPGIRLSATSDRFRVVAHICFSPDSDQIAASH
jgi:hypothetical protein